MYYTIYDFMYRDLELKGIDLNVFALLYSFKEYKGSLESICKVVGVNSLTTIQTSLKRLLDMGVLKKDKPSNHFSTCTYTINFQDTRIPQHPKVKESLKRREWNEKDMSEKCKIGEW